MSDPSQSQQLRVSLENEIRELQAANSAIRDQKIKDNAEGICELRDQVVELKVRIAIMQTKVAFISGIAGIAGGALVKLLHW